MPKLVVTCTKSKLTVDAGDGQDMPLGELALGGKNEPTRITVRDLVTVEMPPGVTGTVTLELEKNRLGLGGAR